jgi:hypothetical protein
VDDKDFEEENGRSPGDAPTRRRRSRREALALSILSLGAEGHPHDPQARGYCVVYHEDEVNHCPGCGRTQWYVGRVSAECGFCATALPLASASARGPGTHSRGWRPVYQAA